MECNLGNILDTACSVTSAKIKRQKKKGSNFDSFCFSLDPSYNWLLSTGEMEFCLELTILWDNFRNKIRREILAHTALPSAPRRWKEPHLTQRSVLDTGVKRGQIACGVWVDVTQRLHWAVGGVWVLPLEHLKSHRESMKMVPNTFLGLRI
jgi:hypothetical protein